MGQELLKLEKKQRIILGLFRDKNSLCYGFERDNSWPYIEICTGNSFFEFSPDFMRHYHWAYSKGCGGDARFYDRYNSVEFRRFVENFFAETFISLERCLNGDIVDNFERGFDEVGFLRKFSLEILQHGGNIECLVFAHFVIERWNFFEKEAEDSARYYLEKITILETCRRLAKEWDFYKTADCGYYRNEYLKIRTTVFYEIAQTLLSFEQYDKNLEYALRSYEFSLCREIEKVVTKDTELQVEDLYSKILELVRIGEVVTGKKGVRLEDLGDIAMDKFLKEVDPCLVAALTNKDSLWKRICKFFLSKSK